MASCKYNSFYRAEPELDNLLRIENPLARAKSAQPPTQAASAYTRPRPRLLASPEGGGLMAF